jgi:hypothetical protein
VTALGGCPGSETLRRSGCFDEWRRLPVFMERHIRIIMDAHMCCLMDRHIRIKMDAYISISYKYRASYSVPYVLVSAGSIGSVAAGVGRIGAVLSSGDAAVAGPGEGGGELGGRRRVDGDCGAVLSGGCRVGHEKLKLRNWLRTDSVGRYSS